MRNGTRAASAMTLAAVFLALMTQTTPVRATETVSTASSAGPQVTPAWWSELGQAVAAGAVSGAAAGAVVGGLACGAAGAGAGAAEGAATGGLTNGALYAATTGLHAVFGVHTEGAAPSATSLD